jgi:hypothetical protein
MGREAQRRRSVCGRMERKGEGASAHLQSALDDHASSTAAETLSLKSVCVHPEHGYFTHVESQPRCSTVRRCGFTIPEEADCH